MTSIGIFSGNESLHTKNILSRLYAQANRSVSIFTPDDPDDNIGSAYGNPGQIFQILIVNKESEDLPRYIAGLSPCGILIINGDNNDILPYLKGVKARLITYGYNQKACVTASSITTEELQCCIQRLLPTFSGKALEPQEFSVRSLPEASLKIQDCHKNIYTILSAITAALLDDVYRP